VPAVAVRATQGEQLELEDVDRRIALALNGGSAKWCSSSRWSS